MKRHDTNLYLFCNQCMFMPKMVRLDDDTYSMLDDLKHILRKRSMASTIREMLDNVMEEEEDDDDYQADFEDFDEE